MIAGDVFVYEGANPDYTQDIDTWSIYVSVNGGDYIYVSDYTQPWHIISYEEESVRIYVFAPTLTIPAGVLIDDMVRYKFVPSGLDAGGPEFYSELIKITDREGFMSLGSKGGNIASPWGDIHEKLEQMSCYYDSFPMSVSGLGAYVTDGYLDMNAWKEGQLIAQIHNAGSAEATVIYRNYEGTDVTLKLAQNQFTGKLPYVQYIKQSGTSDSLTIFTQKFTRS